MMAHGGAAPERHDEHPSLALLWSGGMLVLSLTVPGGAGVALCIAAIFFHAIVIRGLSPYLLMRRVRVPLLFALMGAATLPLEVGWSNGRPTLGLSSERAFADALLLFFRSSSAILAMATLFLSERLEGLLAALARLGLPATVVELAHLVYASIHDLMGALESMELAAEARLGFSTTRNRIRSAGLLASGLWLQALLNGRRKQQGLATRGLESFNFLSTVEIPRLTLVETLCAASVFAVLIGASFALRSLMP
jgi:cobalt/nickel transport system permease protein